MNTSTTWLALGLALILSIAGCRTDEGSATELVVYKSPTCGCCEDWIAHMEERQFIVNAEHPDNLQALKRELGIGAEHASCHTGVSDSGYVFEGHLPAKLVRRFLQQPPEGALGLAVPRMPIGSPGMEMGER